MVKVKIFGRGYDAVGFLKRVDFKYFQIVAITDSYANDDDDDFMGIHVLSLNDWINVECDYIVICTSRHEEKIVKMIRDKGVDDSKLIEAKELFSRVYFDEYKECYSNNDLFDYFNNDKHRITDKWMHYFPIYDKWLNKYRDTDVVICEIGVYKGGSLQMWKKYFGPKCTVIGIDINEECIKICEDQINIEIGSQSDVKFWDYIKEKYPRIDILIDDGGHSMEQQIITFESMFEHIAEGGIYICEDLHTSYWKEYGGGYLNANSFIEYSKHLIDKINAFHMKSNLVEINNYGIKLEDPRVDTLTTSISGIHYYDSMLVVEKEEIKTPPFRVIKGEEEDNKFV